MHMLACKDAICAAAARSSTLRLHPISRGLCLVVLRRCLLIMPGHIFVLLLTSKVCKAVDIRVPVVGRRLCAVWSAENPRQRLVNQVILPPVGGDGASVT